MAEKNRLKAEPFYFPGSDTGCLLIHGFTGTPAEMNELGLYLSNCGHTVSGICLPGHGTTPGQMAETGCLDWINGAARALEQLARQCRRVMVGGLSMGGTISLYLASKYKVDGVFTICSPVFLNIKNYLPTAWKYLKNLDKELWLDIRDPQAKATHAGYHQTPLRCGIELLILLQMTRRQLPLVNVPALVVQARTDRTVPPENAEVIYRALPCPEKKIVWLERSGHVATVDYDKSIVFDKVAKFIGEIG